MIHVPNESVISSVAIGESRSVWRKGRVLGTPGILR